MTDKTRLPEIRAFMNEVENSRRSDATYHKVVFHVHSPESHDYLPLSLDPHNDTQTKVLTELDLFQYGLDNDYWGADYCVSINDIYNDQCEHLAFLLLVAKLVQQQVDGFILTDHNTFNGFHKVNEAISEYKAYRDNVKINVIQGIEVSCADSVHVIGIFDNHSDILEFKDWLKDYLFSIEQGTFKTSVEVLQKIIKCNGLGYPAHLNTSELFGNDNAYSGAYKKTLVTLPGISVFGVKNMECLPKLKVRLSQCADNFDLSPVLEDDSHSVPVLGEKYVWMKCKTVSAIAIRNAFRDPKTQLCNSIEKPIAPNNKIISLFVGGEGFLGNNSADVIRFSDELTSLIGGRGVGKSTILQCLDFLTTGRVSDSRTLKHILDQGTLCVHVMNNERNYYVLMLSTNSENNYTTVSDYTETENGKLKYLDSANIKRKQWSIIKNRLQVFEDKLALDHEVRETRKLKKFFEQISIQSFEATTLISAARAQDISAFIRHMLDLTTRYKFSPRKRHLNGVLTGTKVKKALAGIKASYLFHEKQLEELLTIFNKRENNKLLLEMNLRNDLDEDSCVMFWLSIFQLSEMYSSNLKNGFNHWQIDRQGVIDFVLVLSKKYGVLESVDMILDNDTSKFTKILLPITRAYENTRFGWADKDKVSDNIDKFIEEIGDKLQENSNIVEAYLNQRLINMEKFTLKFNVANSSYLESVMKPRFHEVNELSMGQTIVAMLSFVLSMGSLIGINNPILLDQPEDNLDSQYIYYNLVKDLIALKHERQVLLASHNSTIVVGSGSELVLSMHSSDATNGWVKVQGYTAETRVLNEIIAVMEGGTTAMREKLGLYSGLL
ncbi:Spaf_1101 family AAA-like ATPase [Lactiplantibacillus plantarum]|uniref:Spaf_1101 family AAA-like ATPase n=3 Tax=Lactiplantibacillus plantarum TaxID=1590 RepID=UPI0028FC22C0|nr:AAA family ATPase [Lactiplantibacillus plantarum]WNW15003.1 AAA family ATPase [Lactiplantibacillus plantarum]